MMPSEKEFRELQLESRTNAVHIKQIIDMFSSHKNDMSQKLDGIKVDIKDLVKGLIDDRKQTDSEIASMKEGLHERRTEENEAFTKALEKITSDLSPIKKSYEWLTSTRNFLIKVPLVGAGLVFVVSILAKALHLDISK